MSKALTLATLLVVCSVTLAVADAPSFFSFDYPLAGVTDTEGTGITPSGVIVGRYFTPDHKQHGFVLSYGTITPIDIPGSDNTDVDWVNARGDISGTYQSGGMQPAYVLNPSGHMTTIEYPGETITTGWGISNAGIVVGTAFSNDFFSAHGYMYSHGAFTTIDYPEAPATWPTGISDSGYLVGTYFGQDSVFHGFMLYKGQFSTIDVPNSTFTWITGVNTAGHVVGFYNDAAGAQHGFVLRKGQFITIDIPGATSTEANGINPQDQVVGRYVTTDGHTHGYFLGKIR